MDFKNNLTESMLEAGKYIDAKDSSGKWCVGIILDSRYNNLYQRKIHFYGWSSIHDEIIKTNSNKLAQFR